MSKISRKKFLKKAALGAVVAPTLLSGCVEDGGSTTSTGPNIQSGKKYKLTMVTTWPPKFRILGEGCDLLAKWVKEMSGGRLTIKVYGGGEMVPALEAFGAVSAGTVDMAHGCPYYWVGKAPAAQFFASVPFGLNAQQVNAWITHSGGMDLWKELYAKFNLIPFLGGNTGVQMGGWFNKEINTITDFKGLKMRIPGIGGKVIEQAGGAAVLVAGSEIYTSLERGVIDATEWIGPYHDYVMGFHKIAKYYYSPGWHECGTNLEFMMYKPKYESLPADLQAILQAGTARVNSWMLHEFEAKNAEYLSKIKSEGKVEMRKFSPEILAQLRTYTDKAVQELIANDEFAKRTYDSLQKFSAQIKPWSILTEQEYYNNIQK